MSQNPPSIKHPKTLTLFSYEWDAIAFNRLKTRWPQLHLGFDLFSFPDNARLAWLDLQRFASIATLKAKLYGARAVVSNQEHFGALIAALIAEKMHWPGTPVEAIVACQHKLHAREVLQRVAPEANVAFSKLDAVYDGAIPEGIDYPVFVKPVKAAFSVLAKRMESYEDLYRHSRFGRWELWVIRHLVEPFDRIRQQRLPQAVSAHSLMLEQPLRGPQYCLDGYFFNNEYRHIGIVDSLMYPGTSQFMRFDYPSTLPQDLQQQAQRIAETFMRAIGFTHGLFNMEFIHDEASGQLKVIEFNPRMASQFSDLYARVEGWNLHEMVLAMAHGIDPQTLPRTEPTASCAASFAFRTFDPQIMVPQPSAAQLQAFHKTFPDALLFQYPKHLNDIQRDFKWLDSYRYGIVHLGGNGTSDLRARCEQACTLLGWPAPYDENREKVPGLSRFSAQYSEQAASEQVSG